MNDYLVSNIVPLRSISIITEEYNGKTKFAILLASSRKVLLSIGIFPIIPLFKPLSFLPKVNLNLKIYTKI